MHGASAPSPSAWSRRLPIAALATIGAVIAAYLAAYQYGLIGSVWDPVFGGGSKAVLTSSLDRMLPLHDALLGAVAYAVEAVLTFAGGSDRARSHPWLVLLFGLVSLSLVATAATLVVVQAFVVRSFCLLCLGSAAISFVVGALAWDEVAAALAATGVHLPTRSPSHR